MFEENIQEDIVCKRRLRAVMFRKRRLRVNNCNENVKKTFVCKRRLRVTNGDENVSKTFV